MIITTAIEGERSRVVPISVTLYDHSTGLNCRIMIIITRVMALIVSASIVNVVALLSLVKGPIQI